MFKILFRNFLAVCAAFTGILLNAQETLPSISDSNFSPYYHQRVSLFRNLPQTTGDIIFIGNSLTNGGEWGELFNDPKIKNRGISGDISTGVINRLEEVITKKPTKIFLLIGINDLSKGVQSDHIVRNIMSIASRLKTEQPSVKLYVQSLLPVNPEIKQFRNHTNKTQAIKVLNQLLSDKANEGQYTFVDMYPHFSNEQGYLNRTFTNDGLHLNGAGYMLWKHLVFPFVYDLEQRAALIPLPQKLVWKQGAFPLYQCKTILVHHDTLNHEAAYLKNELYKIGWQADIKNKVEPEQKYIELLLVKNQANAHPESYELSVDANKIVIKSGTPHGIFNGIQTLRQLWRDRVMIDQCFIKDQPTYSWRGYLIDVGRNYMSLDLLKEQIDVMSRYKLNVFHFHSTEDIAWRLEVKKYPQLTAPENMLRNKGMYYTQKEIADLIDYCKQRHILFLPEIDMPGHSAAFKRAMSVDMQSDSGIVYLKAILKEFCATYDLPYIHIGADEVKIINPDFVPEITKYLEGLGRKVIGWQPGGNFTKSTIRQLWMGDGKHSLKENGVHYIDSRHLYLNHMDPLEAVVTLFNRQMGSGSKNDTSFYGATLCMWHDRAVSHESDILKMNPVYPGMVAFSERVWRGGGTAGWVSNISDGNETRFLEFEERLLNHKNLYFNHKPFTYVRQGNIKWKLIGPYFNNGNVDESFPPESPGFVISKDQHSKEVTGGTIVLRHWWAPLIKGAIDEPKENTTWYAATSLWSDVDCEKKFWIGFNNLSRSPATDSPPYGEWDSKGSKVWVNGKLISPPSWARPNQKGHSEIPLIDEGYEYRLPTIIALHKGWNKVLIKVPVQKFNGKDWQNPVKWMFTFVPVD